MIGLVFGTCDEALDFFIGATGLPQGTSNEFIF